MGSTAASSRGATNSIRAGVAWTNSHSGRRLPAVVDSFPVDESVYGIRGLAGNIQDWCSDLMLPEGPVVEDQRVVVVPPVEAGHEARLNARGGMWTGGGQYSRCTGRQGGSPAQRLYTRGIRVCRPYGSMPDAFS